MRQETGYEPAQGALMISTPALGRLLAIPAVVGYVAYLPISAAMAALAWRLWSPPVRRSFLVLAAGALITGLLIHLLPHGSDGGVGGVGIVLVIAAQVPLWIGVFRLKRMEATLARSELR
ncbi:MAG: hypothetical protein ABT19_10455 [Rhodanobacter sp. SCN 68-63]|mgnify:CR=1 FL=1|nr:MAG: hypothetical protein ABT19_10455 [Rhodanobacter sp. SCN 68-63]